MKTVLITGAGIGIGRATAKMFGTHGWRVIVTDVLEDEGAVVAAEINASGGTAEFHTLDVTSTAVAEAVLASVHANHGPLAALVCNAGIAHKVPLEELTDEKWDHTFEIDLKGMIRVIRPVVAQMKLVGDGAIVCLSSIMGVAYGWDDIGWANKTIDFVPNYLKELEKIDNKTVDGFIKYWENKIFTS